MTRHQVSLQIRDMNGQNSQSVHSWLTSNNNYRNPGVRPYDCQATSQPPTFTRSWAIRAAWRALTYQNVIDFCGLTSQYIDRNRLQLVSGGKLLANLVNDQSADSKALGDADIKLVAIISSGV